MSQTTVSHKHPASNSPLCIGARVRVTAPDSFIGKKGTIQYFKDGGRSVYVNLDSDFRGQPPLYFAPWEIEAVKA